MTKIPPSQHIPEGLHLSDKLIIQAGEEFGSPFYMYDKYKLQQNWKFLTNNLPKAITVHYSVKANPNLAIIRLFADLGASFEVASIGELKAVLHAGVPPSHIIFVGPGKKNAELQYAIAQQIGLIVAESSHELGSINHLSASLEQRVRIALRINPGTGHGMLTMGGQTQFGMEPKEALNLLRNEKNFGNVDIIGMHCYLGTQILDWKLILEHFRLVLELSDQIQKKIGKVFRFVDLGGGFGIPYYEVNQTLDLSSLNSSLSHLISEYQQQYPTTETIAVESGRFLVGPAGIFVARVVDIKHLYGQCFVVLDGGVNVFGGHDRYVGARPLPIRVLCAKGPMESLTLCGPLCTPLDRLAANVELPMPSIGSLVVFYLAGAYGYTASPGLFLSHGFPYEILAMEEELACIRRATSPDDLFFDQCV